MARYWPAEQIRFGFRYSLDPDAQRVYENYSQRWPPVIWTVNQLSQVTFNTIVRYGQFGFAPNKHFLE